MRGFAEDLLVKDMSGARPMMDKLESEGWRRGRTLFVVDAETGGSAEGVLRECGYVEAGTIPDYGTSPSGRKMGGIFFYKELRAPEVSGLAMDMNMTADEVRPWEL
ncbi:uncharacterized protein B0I36DRAFT_367027 [Microdochium trichocladiopsis]|uniref:Uncharacterized protein n=1 Tax=Microdochium trichocladiopsis TaxID=1682393 RepID=A0A9P8XYI7_9PEZI|nr:uncharacterized protein B0I36DRAFT_367027 [Microdochium trichocladiopsis]KAH7025141.1 hypothetical protein B0I36DRAFT_367027 [Microdochium trichocladiopsis]